VVLGNIIRHPNLHIPRIRKADVAAIGDETIRRRLEVSLFGVRHGFVEGGFLGWSERGVFGVLLGFGCGVLGGGEWYWKGFKAGVGEGDILIDMMEVVIVVIRALRW
jgi:hypothetical protein